MVGGNIDGWGVGMGVEGKIIIIKHNIQIGGIDDKLENLTKACNNRAICCCCAVPACGVVVCDDDEVSGVDDDDEDEDGVEVLV